MTKPLKLALVGAGIMGNFHARVIAQSERCELKYVIDPRQAEGEATAKRFGADWRAQLPDLDDVDGVIVAAATEAHHSIATAVLNSGTALLIEKPVSASLQETEEVITLAHQKDLPLMCGLLERFNPAIMTVAEIIESPLHIMTRRHSQYAPRIKTGVAWDLLIHDVDLILRIANNSSLREIQGIAQTYHPESLASSEDVAEANLLFESGVIGHASASRIGHRKIREMLIYEKDRLIEVDLLRHDLTIFHNVSVDAPNEGRNYRQQTVIEIPELIKGPEPLAAQLNHFADLIEEKADKVLERNSILPSHQAIDAILAR